MTSETESTKEIQSCDNREGKGVWDDSNPFVENQKKYGRKTFITEKIAKYCANEIVCRIYLNNIGFSYIAYIGRIIVDSDNVGDPNSKTQELNEYINETLNAEDIKNYFEDKCQDIEKKIKELDCHKIIIFIEIGDDTIDSFNNLASEYNNNKEEINLHIKNLFKILNELHNNNFVHADLKPENFLYAERNGKRTILLNDFDTSFIIKPENTYGYNHSYASPPYTAPELLGMFNKKISYKTDIFMVGLICYQLLNENKLPRQIREAFLKLNDMNGRHQDYGYKDFVDALKDLFKNINNKEDNFNKPENGEKNYVKAVMRAISINPNDRPNAEQVLKILDGKENFSVPLLFFSLLIVVIFVSLLLLKRINYTDNISINRNGKTEIPVTETINSSMVNTEIATTLETTTISQPTISTSSNTEIKHDTTTPNHSSTTNVASTRDEDEQENTTDDENDNSSTQTTETVVNTSEPTEAELSFDYVLKEIDGGDYFDSVSGIMITGFSGELPETLYIPDKIDGEKVIAIGNDVFSGCNIKSLVIPDTVYEIGDAAFRSCHYLSDIYLGKNVIIIGKRAFYNSQFQGSGTPTITITNFTHNDEEAFHGEQWDGRNHDYNFVYKY